MKLTRILAWIGLVVGCLAAAIAEPRVVSGVEADSDFNPHIIESIYSVNTQAFNVQER
jgi:hypothetical protein